MSGKRIPIPSGFRELASESSTAELAKACGLSKRTIQKWRRECGVPAPPRIRKAIDSGQYEGMDTPEQIQYCLHCPVKTKCYGLRCPLLREVGKEKRA